MSAIHQIRTAARPAPAVHREPNVGALVLQAQSIIEMVATNLWHQDDERHAHEITSLEAAKQLLRRAYEALEEEQRLP